MSDPKPPMELVAGKYRLTRLLGQGGMGAVWEGVHTSLGGRVAIKFIDHEYAESEEAQQRFLNEARAAAQLRTKHVVGVHDQGVTEDGRPYIVMEFLAGEPLDKRLARVDRLSLQDTARIIIQVCRALTKAHAAGIVHRDLKPENIFLVLDDEDGTEIAKVVDFGIAKFTDQAMGVSSSTRTGSVLGTPFYMSPEQARGLRNLDVRSDLWSLGVIAFRCVTGRLPFEGEAMGDLLVKICTAPLPVPTERAPDLPPSFDVWFSRALEREPDARFQTAAEVSESLAEVAGFVEPRSALPSSVTMLAPPAVTLPPPVALTPAAQTVSSFTHSANAPRRGVPLALILGGAAALLMLLGLGVVVVVKVAGASDTPAAALSAETDPAPAVATEPSAPATGEGEAEAEGEGEGEAAADPSAQPEPPVVSAPPKPVATARPAGVKPKPGPRPGPKPVAAPVAAPKPAPKPVSKPVDLGY